MEFINNTSFPSIAWSNWDKEGNDQVSIVARIKYKFVKTNHQDAWKLQLDDSQGGLFGAEQFYKDDNEQSLKYESDYIFEKPSTDVVVNAISYAPNNKAVKQWLCSITIGIPDSNSTVNVLLSKVLKVMGPRQFKKTLTKKWKLTEPDPVTQVPIRYELAFGGAAKAPDKDKNDGKEYFGVYEKNPIGKGYYHKKLKKNRIAAPQIEDPDKPVLTPDIAYQPQGFGFIHRSWKSRLKWAGTFDEQWQKEQWPLLPKDYDKRHEQAAHPSMVTKEYLQGGEYVVLKHLHADSSKIIFQIPEFNFTGKLYSGDQQYPAMLNLDTLIVDISDKDSEKWRVYTSYRIRLPEPAELSKVELDMIVPEAYLALQETDDKEELEHG